MAGEIRTPVRDRVHRPRGNGGLFLIAAGAVRLHNLRRVCRTLCVKLHVEQHWLLGVPPNVPCKTCLIRGGTLGSPSPGSGLARTTPSSRVLCLPFSAELRVVEQLHLHGDRFASTVNSAVFSEQTLEDLPFLLPPVSILGGVYVTAQLTLGCLQTAFVTLKLVSTGTLRAPTRTPSGPTLWRTTFLWRVAERVSVRPTLMASTRLVPSSPDLRKAPQPFFGVHLNMAQLPFAVATLSLHIERTQGREETSFTKPVLEWNCVVVCGLSAFPSIPTVIRWSGESRRHKHMPVLEFEFNPRVNAHLGTRGGTLPTVLTRLSLLRRARPLVVSLGLHFNRRLI